MTTPRIINFILAAAALVSAPPPARAQGPEAQASANEKFERGKQLYERGDAEAAIPFLRDAAESHKKDADAWYIYGHAGGESAGVFRLSEVTTRALITYKPEPGFTEEARQNNVTGVVRLRAVLAADGHVR